MRIFGPGATVAQDLEPEYITVWPGHSTACVTLQENNAIAIDRPRQASRVASIVALGTSRTTAGPAPPGRQRSGGGGHRQPHLAGARACTCPTPSPATRPVAGLRGDGQRGRRPRLAGISSNGEEARAGLSTVADAHALPGAAEDDARGSAGSTSPVGPATRDRTADEAHQPVQLRRAARSRSAPRTARLVWDSGDAAGVHHAAAYPAASTPATPTTRWRTAATTRARSLRPSWSAKLDGRKLRLRRPGAHRRCGGLRRDQPAGAWCSSSTSPAGCSTAHRPTTAPRAWP